MHLGQSSITLVSSDFFVIIFCVGDERDKMYIMIEGTVEFSVNMKTQTLTNDEIKELGEDLGVKDLTNMFHKYKHTHRLYPN